MVIWIL